MRRSRTFSLLFGCFLLVFPSSSSHAQEKAGRKNYLQVGVGVASFQELGVRLGNSLTFLFPVSKRVERVQGPFQVGYLRDISPKCKLGAILSYTYLHTNSFHHHEEQGAVVITKAGEEKLAFYTFMPTVEYTWTKTEKVQLYSGLSLGLFVSSVEERFILENTTQHRSAKGYFGHLNILGVRVGRRIGGYLEGGFGVHGLLSGGVYGTL